MAVTFHIDIKLDTYDISLYRQLFWGILASSPYSKFITIARSYLLEGAISLALLSSMDRSQD